MRPYNNVATEGGTNKASPRVASPPKLLLSFFFGGGLSPPALLMALPKKAMTIFRTVGNKRGQQKVCSESDQENQETGGREILKWG